MGSPLLIDVITVFPGMLEGFLRESILKRAAEKGLVRLRTVQLRDFATDARRTTDDRPYGGGPGMVMIPGPIFDAVAAVRTPAARIVLMSPQGRRFDQSMAEDFAREEHLVFICGHYEGVDERVREFLATDEVSVGDYVLTNGVLPAATVIDATVRLREGVLGHAEATAEESFARGTLEYPHYTRPADFRGYGVPPVLLSGDHAAIAQWRREQSARRTAERRPDMQEKNRKRLADSIAIENSSRTGE
jgi:tRNA (guanine37-N1)-methyltransferase